MTAFTIQDASRRSGLSEALARLRAVGVGIQDRRTYQVNRTRGRAAAAEQRDLLLRHAARIEAEIVAQQARLGYLRAKAALWDARARGDADDAGLELVVADPVGR